MLDRPPGVSARHARTLPRRGYGPCGASGGDTRRARHDGRSPPVCPLERTVGPLEETVGGLTPPGLTPARDAGERVCACPALRPDPSPGEPPSAGGLTAKF